MHTEVKKVIVKYEERYRCESGTLLSLPDAPQAVLLPVGPDCGQFMNSFLKTSKVRSILELGTSYGYSTIYLAEAARANSGIVTSCDFDAEKQIFANHMLRQAGLEGHVVFRSGEAIEEIDGLDGEIEFCLIDLWNSYYIPALDALYPKLAPLAYVIADNITSPDPVAGESYRHHIRLRKDIESILLPIGWGLELSTRRASNGWFFRG
ncbi:O-methyltransferase [Mesorhizobium onobrychidis]|uniref:Class I SAM-dependent methyltransferase n=1 Tax=Mesorhizobium onobrychidis TaxID=2775404 RepID=A0ABY5QVW0_9HYPH|nr:class I SAM-dependent methyltransferase [Mesorhizobium onobrychidis]UVC15365.1 class I SAM-dependent methyltransferase [Mesorhizobium onobrychidis]